MLPVDPGSSTRLTTPTFTEGNDEEKYQLFDVQQWVLAGRKLNDRR